MCTKYYARQAKPEPKITTLKRDLCRNWLNLQNKTQLRSIEEDMKGLTGKLDGLFGM